MLIFSRGRGLKLIICFSETRPEVSCDTSPEAG